MFIRPWSKESEKILFRLAKDRSLFIKNSSFTRTLGLQLPKEAKKDFIGMAHNNKNGETIIALRPGIGLAPFPTRQKYAKFHFFKIF